MGSISLIKEKASFHPSIDESITDLKDKIYELRKICTNWIKTIETDLIPNSSSDPNNASLAKIERNVNEILRVSYIFGIELQNDIIKFMTQNRAKSFAQGLAQFSIQWCDYIVSKTDRGKGRTTRPWAANKGLHLVQVAVAHSVHLSSWEFSRLVQAVERCFSHLIGDNEHDSDCLLKPLARNISTSSRSLSFTPKITNKSLPPRNRFDQACQQFDQEIEKRRFKDRSIGKILEINRQDWIIAGTEVQFRWQLGLLIGEGSFGKVYSCVNLDTWEPMALKIIEFKNNTDLQNLQEIADEINNVVDINHENLVKVYGSELHRKEIFIFMEFCGDQCTLDRLSRDASGLPENLVRKYTKSLLKGVEYLHERNIIHRDVKGANIFLKSIDNRHPEKVVLKLGDFGCSIRLKDPIGTASRDQATGLRGTYAFMAPEVMASGGLKDEGYTYSADIWSVGCVVIEMFTGKRPWHPFKDEAILFKVHLSGDSEKKPSFPVPISEEANHFLNCCFEFEPDKRLLADQLLELSFAKVVDEDSVYD
ncbi:mitogen-activated kinase kinase kinase 4 isoform X1 [Brachionus plicatilis]|uniref:Mitogen-activated kinase kinase kinase 4 isoform X1 n=1 Tax=Brachionus plicatilis TaxID=10195 RepID=A0A3M7QX60_BRAPC|nr:mitogen-activated kinase kinase kinase 4 isoform X1 [Brachionus plicatilis]